MATQIPNQAPAETPLIATNIDLTGHNPLNIGLVPLQVNSGADTFIRSGRPWVLFRFWVDLVPTVSIIDAANLVIIQVGLGFRWSGHVGCNGRDCGWPYCGRGCFYGFRVLDRNRMPLRCRDMTGTYVGLPVTGWVDCGLRDNDHTYNYQIPREAEYLERRQYVHMRTQVSAISSIDREYRIWYYGAEPEVVTRFQIGININRWACQQAWNRDDPGARCVNYCNASIPDCQRFLLPRICPQTNPEVLDTPICRNIHNSENFYDYFGGLVGNYCTGENLRTPFCTQSCVRGIYNNTCTNAIVALCTGAELARPDSPCLQNYCFNVVDGANTSMCNPAIEAFCAIRNEDGSWPNSNNPICYCYMPAAYYLNNLDRFVHDIPNLTETAMASIRDFLLLNFNAGNNRPFCNDPRCSASAAVRPPFPQRATPCPDNVFCLNYISFGIEARKVTINGGINIDQGGQKCTQTRNHVQGLVEKDDEERAEAARKAEEERRRRLEEQRQEVLGGLAKLALESDTAESAVIAARAVLASKTPGTPEHAAAQAVLEAALLEYERIQKLIKYDNNFIETGIFDDQSNGQILLERQPELNTSNTGLYIGIAIGVIVLAVIIGVIIWFIRKRKANMASSPPPIPRPTPLAPAMIVPV